MDTVTYEFREWREDGTNVDLEFTVNDTETNCWDFHDMCKKFAIAVGYLPETVEKCFGATNYEEKFNI